MTDRRATLPSVERLLGDPGIAALLTAAPRSAVVAAVRESVEAARRSRAGRPDDWATDVAERLHTRVARSLVPAYNATGVVLHTNLGRAPLAPAALDAVVAIASGYSTLELDRASGSRGTRSDHVKSRLVALTGAADALVVNNAAGALTLAVYALAGTGEVAISRGELIEIGGSFRIPEIVESTGARLHEIGTTNRTHLDDYREVFGSVAAVLIVHRSNFTQQGFVATPRPEEIVGAAHAASLRVMHDVGGGLLHDLSDYGLSGEPIVGDAVRAGSDLVIFSGDKLLGGPQAGILVGSGDAIAACRRHPFARAVRADKLTLAALDATLGLHETRERALREVPTLAMLTASEDTLRSRAERLAAACRVMGSVTLVEGVSTPGGGAFPDTSLPTVLVQIGPGSLGAEAMALRLRLGSPCVIARVADAALLLDPRTLSDESIPAVGAAVSRALASD